MRALVLGLVLTTTSASVARAEFIGCFQPHGASPASGEVLPLRAHVALYGPLSSSAQLGATLDGVKVPIKVTAVTSRPFFLFLIEIDSPRAGALTISDGARPLYQYRVAATTPAPRTATSVIAGLIGRPRPDERPNDAFDGLEIRLPAGTPATLAHVKLRRDAATDWQALEVPLVVLAGETRPVIRIGRFDCEASYPVELLAKGIDLEVSVTFTDGSTHQVTLAPHLTLPTPLPPQPRPKNQRPRAP